MLSCLFSWVGSSAETVEEDALLAIGDTFPEFRLVDYKTGESVSRDDFAGGILVIDFCAWWCGPCQRSAPGLRSLIDQYYLEQGGNAAGIPVYVMTIMGVDENRSSLDEFIETLHLDRVLEDENEPRLVSQLPTEGYIPYFVIVNGVSDDPSHEQWELLFTERGFRGNELFTEGMRPVIDSVTGTAPDPMPQMYRDPYDQTVRAGKTVEFHTGYSGKGPFTVSWFKDGDLIPEQTSSVLSLESATVAEAGLYHVEIKNDFGTVVSQTARLIVTQRYDDWIRPASLSKEDALPDADPDGDGQTNFAEYVQATNPVDGADRNVPVLRSGETAGEMAIDFQISTAVLSAEYVIESSSGLDAWTAIDEENASLLETPMGSRLLLSMSVPVMSEPRFWRLRMFDPDTKNLVLREGEVMVGALTDIDEISAFYWDEYGEVYYYDSYRLQGLVDGEEYSVIVKTDEGFNPGVEFNGSVSGGEPLFYSLANLYEGDDIASVYSFIADAALDYSFNATTEYQEVVGHYEISLARTSYLTPLELNELVVGELDGDVDLGLWDDPFLPMDPFRLSELPLGREITVFMEPDAPSDTIKASIELHDGHTLAYLFSSSYLATIPGENEVEAVPLTFIAEAGRAYVMAATLLDYDYIPFGYTLWVEETDLIPDLRPGDTVSDIVNRESTWYFDDIDYHVDFYELADGESGVPVNLVVSSEDAEDVRIFVCDARNWELLFKDIPSQTSQSETTFFIPREGKRYFIGVGLPEREVDTHYTLSVTQE